MSALHLTDDERDAFEERAALIQYDGDGKTRPQAEAIALQEIARVRAKAHVRAAGEALRAKRKEG